MFPVSGHILAVAVLVAVTSPCVLSFRIQASKSDADFTTMGDCSVPNPFFNASGARHMCDVCLQKNTVATTCKWCPLSQTCVKSGWWSGESCEGREGHPEDEKVKASQACSVHPPPWYKVMNEAYGVDWASNRKKHLDAIRCIQWGLGWPVESDSGFESKATADEVGRWGCVSALTRWALLKALRFKPLPVTQTPVENASLAQIESNASAGKPWWYYERLSWSPELCSIISKKLKEEENTCYVRAWQIEEFNKLIEAVGSPNGKDSSVLEQLIASIESGPLVPLKPGAGKSGSGFAKLGDGGYVMKLGLKYRNSMNEPENLMNLVKDAQGKQHLLEHYRKHPSSLLNRYYGMLKIALGEMRSYSVLMHDGFYHMDSKAKKEMDGGEAVSFTRYDLKGASRNQKEKRGTGFALINGDFKAREDATIQLSGEQCLSLRSAVAADADFLSSHNMIDYSLLMLSVNKKPIDTSGDIEKSGKRTGYQSLTCGSTPGEPYCFEKGKHMYTLTIIDYLNDLNAFKSMESIFVKWGKFWEYGKSVKVYAKKICPTPAELSFKRKLNQLILDNNGSIEKAFQDLDKDGEGKVNKEELETFLTGLGITKEEAAQIYSEMDADADGSLDFAAFSYLFD